MTTPDPISRRLVPGDPAPRFRAPVLGSNPNFSFDSMAGRMIVLFFQGSGTWSSSAAALKTLAAHRHLFDDVRTCFFGISIDRSDVPSGRIRRDLPGIRWFLDHDSQVSKLYGAISGAAGAERYHPHWLLLDPLLRVVRSEPAEGGEAIMAELARMLNEGLEAPVAPVLAIPRILDDDTCQRLIALYEKLGGEDSGFMHDEEGVTNRRVDHSFKRRKDVLMPAGQLLDVVKARLHRFLLPQIKHAFQFEVTRVERWLLACYDGDDGGGYFNAHRDNTTHATAHRKFACTINLNAEHYEGGDLRFPEFGRKTYRAPTGGAVVFSCSLLHEALPVTRGRRYALLPFFYDDAGARLRERNLDKVMDELRDYRSGLPPEAQAVRSS